MSPSMVKYQFIEDERIRNKTLGKRKATILKNISELKILSGVDACLVMYEKDDEPPTVWPTLSEAHCVIQTFQESNFWSKNMIQDHKSFLEKNIAKIKKNLEKEKEKHLKHLMVKCLLDEDALRKIEDREVLDGLRSVVDREIEEIDDLIKKACEKANKNM